MNTHTHRKQGKGGNAVQVILLRKKIAERKYLLAFIYFFAVCELRVRESNYPAPIYTNGLFWRASTAFPPSGNEAKSPGRFENKGRSGAILDLTGKCSILDRCFLSVLKVFLCYFILNKLFILKKFTFLPVGIKRTLQ